MSTDSRSQRWPLSAIRRHKRHQRQRRQRQHYPDLRRRCHAGNRRKHHRCGPGNQGHGFVRADQQREQCHHSGGKYDGLDLLYRREQPSSRHCDYRGSDLAGDITLTALGAGDITVSNNIQKAGSGAKTLTLQANENIIFNNSASVGLASGATNTYNVVLNADRDASAGGAIQLNSGTTINSNGGSITLGGGSSPLTTAAIGKGALANGVTLDNAQLISGSGAISIRGTGAAAGGIGVNIGNSSVITASGTAAIQITGTGTAASNDIKVAGGTNSIGGANAAGDILLNGTTGGGMVLGAGGDAATIQTSGNLTLNQSGGGVSQGSGSLLANGLRLVGSGAFNLNQASNDINALVSDLTGATTTLSYRDANGFSIGTGAGGLTTVKTAGGTAGYHLRHHRGHGGVSGQHAHA